MPAASRHTVAFVRSFLDIVFADISGSGTEDFEYRCHWLLFGNCDECYFRMLSSCPAGGICDSLVHAAKIVCDRRHIGSEFSLLRPKVFRSPVSI